VLTLLTVTIPGPVSGQTADKVYRLGALTPSAGFVEGMHASLLPALAREGFVEGRNLVLEVRTGTAAELPALAEELLATEPDAILANGPMAIRAVRAYSTTVPIVGAAIGGDPIANGFAASLARPGQRNGSRDAGPGARRQAPRASASGGARCASHRGVGD
jgi:putative ABC transport system substrate-binding protein